MGRFPSWLFPPVHMQTMPNTGGRVYAIPRTAQEDYIWVTRIPLVGATGSTKVAGGTATVQVGPQGFGTRWYLTQANVSTTTGANDASTVQLFRGPQSRATLLGGTSYAGGQDTIGVNVQPLDPGDFITAVWSTAKNGDIATLTLYGSSDALDGPHAGRG